MMFSFSRKTTEPTSWKCVSVFFFAAGEIEFSNPSALLWTNMRRRERVFTVLSRFLSMGKTEKRKQKQKLDASEGLGCVLVFKRRYGFVHFTAQFSVKWKFFSSKNAVDCEDPGRFVSWQRWSNAMVGFFAKFVLQNAFKSCLTLKVKQSTAPRPPQVNPDRPDVYPRAKSPYAPSKQSRKKRKKWLTSVIISSHPKKQESSG